MAFNASLKLSGQGRTYENPNLISYNFDFNRRLDSVTLSAVGAMEHFKLFFEVRSLGGEKDRVLFQWFINNYTDMSGEIKLYSSTSVGAPLTKTIKFEKGKLFKFEESFDSLGSSAVTLDIGIVAVTLDYADVMIETQDEMVK